jgi:hypothetical protein
LEVTNTFCKLLTRKMRDRGQMGWLVLFEASDVNEGSDEDCGITCVPDANLAGAHPAPPSYTLAKALVRAAFASLFLHEAYHHKTESHAIRLHVVQQLSCFGPYFWKVYNPTRLTRPEVMTCTRKRSPTPTRTSG